LSISADVAPEVTVVTSDRRRVEQILLNLLSNAIKFTDEGGISVACSSDDDRVTIRVTDTGIGIKEEDMDRLFTPFRQIDTGLTRKYEGTGLGLSICKRLATMLGGSMSVKSTLGRGSTFSFAFRAEKGAT
jgi:signal transduction histidine kinase